jgi:hypothetical protein
MDNQNTDDIQGMLEMLILKTLSFDLSSVASAIARLLKAEGYGRTSGTGHQIASAALRRFCLS